MRHAVLSACWGAIPQVLVRDSSVIIVFAALIGAGETASVMSTALIDVSQCLLMLPFAALSDRIGIKPQIVGAITVSMIALAVAAATPWLGVGAGTPLLAALAVFAVAIVAYNAAWFPMLEQIVPLSERGRFFGRLRFSWQLVSTVFIAASAVLGSGVLAETWSLGGIVFSRYHSVFLAAGIGTLLAMMLLVQIPNTVRQVGRLPTV